jgi:hypothetical protein
VILDLQLSHDLLPKDHFLIYQESGSSYTTISNFTATSANLCSYQVSSFEMKTSKLMRTEFQGKIRDNLESFATVDTYDGEVHGEIFDGENTFSMKPESHERNRKLVLVE